MENNQRRALIVGGGGLKGAYTVGVLRRLYDYIGPDQFDAIYTVSVGVFACTFFAAHQIQTMENTWREYVHGSQLIDYLNPLFRGRAILDLDYLVEIFQSSKSFLDLERVAVATPDIFYGLTDYKTAAATWFDARRNRDIIFDLMRASCALPAVYHQQVRINGRRYIDGGVSNPIPVKKAIDDGFSNLVVVLNRPRGDGGEPPSRMLTSFLSRSRAVRCALTRLPDAYKEGERILEQLQTDPTKQVTVIRPSQPLRIRRMTRDRACIIEAIEMGKSDVERAFAQRHSTL